MIGGGYLACIDARTQQVRHRLTVYTSLYTHVSSSSCDWLTRFTYKSCPTVLRKFISNNKPIKGINKMNCI